MLKLAVMRHSTPRFLRQNLDCILLTCSIAVLAIFSCSYIYGSKLNNPPIRSDGFGYYSYLPAVFISHNLSFKLTLDNQPVKFAPKENTYGIGLDKSTGRMFDKYSPGTAILETPFFIGADTFTRLTGGIRTGYSQPYQVAMVTSGIFYLCLGSLLLYITIRRLYGKHIAVLAMLATVFATNVFHYGTYDNSFSQIYSYAAVAMYLYLLMKLMDLGKKGRHRYLWLVAIGLSLGLVALIRVPDSVVALLLLPVLLKDQSLKNFAKDASLVAISCLIALLPMLFYLKYAAGSIFTNPYKVFPVLGYNEGFSYLRSPQIANFLFSVRKGLFFWSPVLLLAFASVGALIKRMKWFGISLALVLCLYIYICASWWVWTFGGSFGSRPFVDMMPLLGLALATGIYYTKGRNGIKVIWAVFVLLAVLNVTLMYSYWHGYIAIDHMNWNMLTKVPSRLQHGL